MALASKLASVYLIQVLLYHPALIYNTSIAALPKGPQAVALV